MRTYSCGHPNTVENTTNNGKFGTGRCKTCKNQKQRQLREASKYERLPIQIQKTKERLAQLESEWLAYQHAPRVSVSSERQNP